MAGPAGEGLAERAVEHPENELREPFAGPQGGDLLEDAVGDRQAEFPEPFAFAGPEGHKLGDQSVGLVKAGF